MKKRVLWPSVARSAGSAQVNEYYTSDPMARGSQVCVVVSHHAGNTVTRLGRDMQIIQVRKSQHRASTQVDYAWPTIVLTHRLRYIFTLFIYEGIPDFMRSHQFTMQFSQQMRAVIENTFSVYSPSLLIQLKSFVYHA